MPSQTPNADHPGGALPVIWLLGPAGSGQTSLVAGLLDSWRSVLRHELTAATATAEMLAWPPEAPRIRFLVTTGLQAGTTYDPAEDIAFIGQAPALVLAVLRVDEPDTKPLHAALLGLRAAGLDWPILLAQTDLHVLYPSKAQHPMPYPYGADGLPGPGVSQRLAAALKAQRDVFAGLATGFVPLDLSASAHGLTPADYGLPALQAAFRRLAPGIAKVLAPQTSPEAGLWPGVILPWAMVAAAADPIPGLAGAAALVAQAMLLRGVSRRFGLASDVAIFANAVGLLGSGLVLRSGLAWLLGWTEPLWAMGGLALWSFLASCLMGAVAIRFCRNESLAYHPSEVDPGQVEEASGRGGARF